MNDQCTRAEVLAGAIALGEATAAERDDYRRHIAGCVACCSSLGGEREIERVMSRVHDARAVETWEPVPLRYNERKRARAWLAGGFAVVTGVAVAVVLQAVVLSSVRPPEKHAAAIAPPLQEVFHVALVPHAAAPAKRAPSAPVTHAHAAPRMLLLHNVISRRGNRVTQTTVSTTEVAQAPIPQITAPPSNVPIWRRDEAMPRTSAVSAPTPTPVLSGRAESIAVAPVVREVEPLGGDAAIVPRPAPIAYAENAFGTTAFEVTVDERGIAIRCDITKSSGFDSLDISVCRAAMKARYEPRLLNGRPTTGVYRDAFTFRQLGDDDQ